MCGPGPTLAELIAHKTSADESADPGREAAEQSGCLCCDRYFKHDPTNSCSNAVSRNSMESRCVTTGPGLAGAHLGGLDMCVPINSKIESPFESARGLNHRGRPRAPSGEPSCS